jgi:tetratricopeptide (TPR) repeat protein
MNRVLLRLLLLGAIGAVLAPGRVLAQSAPAPVDKKPVAKQYVDAGLAAQDSGDYETAITFYLKAYQLVPHPALLFNMAQAHRLAGHIDQALSLYKQYLSEDPSSAQARTARALVSEIEAR